MPLDLAIFSDKVQRYCAQFMITAEELGQATGINRDRLSEILAKKIEPTGDEVLIIADFFKCDFKFFISNEKLAPFEQTEEMFRKHSADFTREDRWAIQEFLFLCECEEFLLSSMQHAAPRTPFSFRKVGTFFKRHGEDAAEALRQHLGYQFNELPQDIYRDFRRVGIHVFRRKLGHSAISGLFVQHPVAGPCVLVNYSEDTFRQRFSAAHEVAHSILDDGADFVVSFSRWDKGNLSEVRANTFASHFLMPPEFLKALPGIRDVDQDGLVRWSVRMMVNTEPLIFALREVGLVSSERAGQLQAARVPQSVRADPELPESLSPRTRARKQELLQRGLSDSYVRLCFEAYANGIVSAGRLAEMLLVNESELAGLTGLYGRRLDYGH
jgi:Zn-dependent peptidase ImmA (M78 family)